MQQQLEERNPNLQQQLEEQSQNLQQQLETIQAIHISVLARREERRQIQPFSEDILAVTVPHDFRVPVMESYDGTGDPNEHLAAFDLQMIISNGSDAQKCKIFGGTLKGTALAWFTALPMRSIQSFDDLSTTFLAQFAAN